MAEQMVLTDEAKGDRFVFPVNPNEIRVSHGRNFSSVQTLRGVEAIIAGSTRAVEVVWRGFFPRDYDPTFCNYWPLEPPEESVRRLRRWMSGSTNAGRPVPLRWQVTGTGRSYLVVLTEFEEEIRGGSPGDVYYALALREWRAQRVRVVQAAASSSPPSDRPPASSSDQTYTVKSGDTLGGIAARFYGDWSKWTTIYERNRAVIGSNPNLIRLGQVLVIPGAVSSGGAQTTTTTTSGTTTSSSRTWASGGSPIGVRPQ